MTTLAPLVCLGQTRLMAGRNRSAQAVHGPPLGGVDPASSGRDHAEHVRRVGPTVAPAMVAERASAAVLAAARPPGTPAWPALSGLAAIGPAWLSTTPVQVPLHRRPSPGFDAAAHRVLVRTDRVRTSPRSVRDAVVLAMALIGAG